MKLKTGVALGVLALMTGIAAPAPAEDLAAEAASAAATEAGWQQVEARLDRDAEAIAADAMNAALRLDLSASLELEERNDNQVLALATEL